MSAPRSQSGLTLVEVMVAMVLLAVALLGLAAAFAPGRMAIQSGDQSTTAVFLARQVLEDMRNRAYDTDTDELVAANFPAATAYGAITNYPGFRRTISIVDDSPATGTKTATVTVFFRGNDGVERSTALTMIYVRAD